MQRRSRLSSFWGLNMENHTAQLSSLLTYKQVAEILSVAPITLRKWVSAGKIASIKIGTSVRFSPEMIEEFIKKSIREGGAV